jgi:tetratricopeptide (TPR) repeat protein
MGASKTLFISRAGADEAFGAEIGRVLETAGYSVVLQQWDFSNRNFIERIHAALSDGARVVALLSPEYLGSDYCAAEWQNAIAGDPLNKKTRLILLRLVECEPSGLLAGIAYWDLVPIRENRPLLEQVVRDAVMPDARTRAPIAGPYWRAPRSILDAEAVRPMPAFTGRDDELKALAAALNDRDAVAAIHGLGGTGKSSLAREYAWRNRERYSVIWWLNAESESNVIHDMVRLGAFFVRGLDELPDRRAAARQVADTLLSGFAKPVLLIFDNLDDESLLRAWRPRTGSQTLVTSRNAAWPPEVGAIALSTLSPSESLEYLRRESRRDDLAEADAHALVDALGSLPLALAHAAAYLRSTRTVSAARYRARITDQLARAPRNAEYPRSVFATFQAAIAEAEQQAPGAGAILCFAARFAPDDVPDELFRQPAELYFEVRPDLPGEAPALDLRTAVHDGLRVDEALGTLDRLSLLTYSQAEQTYSIHRLVRLAAQDIARNGAAEWSAISIAVADALFPLAAFANWPQCARLLPHALAALDALPAGAATDRAAHLAAGCGIYLRERGAYAESESLLARALAMRERILGPSHVDVADTLCGLATVYSEQGRYAEAEPLHVRALEIMENAVGPDRVEILKNLNGLAIVHFHQARFAQSEALFERALAIKERALGPDHINVANTLNGLANVYEHQARYREAEELLVRALAIRERELGAQHPEAATSLSNLAIVYDRQGRYAEAQASFERALTIWEKTLGPDHPLVAMTLNGLGKVHAHQGRYSEADALHTRALAIQEKALGSGHPLVADTLSDLADAYAYQGRNAEADSLLSRALTLAEKTLGHEHGNVADILCGLAAGRRKQGRYREAEELFARALAIGEKLFGADHPDVATSLEGLATVYAEEGRPDDARSLRERALTIREKALGADHPLTQAARESTRKTSPTARPRD